MSYKGQTYSIPFLRGGVTASEQVDRIDPTLMVIPSKNLSMQQGGRTPRGGTAHVNEAAFSDTAQIFGIYQFILVSQTKFILTATNGKIYKNATDTIKTGLSSSKYYNFVTFEDEVFICNGSDTPQTWDGSAASTSDITNPAADWSGGNPQWLVKHGRGNSERLWAFGCPNKPHSIYVSANGDGKEFVTGVTTFRIETGDGYGIAAAVEFGDRIICFSKQEAFYIDDSSSTVSDWGYQTAQWKGGASHWRLVCKTPSDIIAMTDTGEVYSVKAAESYGDYKEASLTRSSFMDVWMRNNLRLDLIDQFHMIYDEQLRAIRIFVVRTGQTQIDTCLVYFIDRQPVEAWMIYDNVSFSSGYSASASGQIKDTKGYIIYTGDYSGNLWKLDQVTKSDEGNAYYSGFKTPVLAFDNPREKKKFKRLWVVAKPETISTDLTVSWWVDNAAKQTETITLDTQGAVLGSFVLGTDKLADEELINKSVPIKAKGTRLQIELSNSVAEEDFFIIEAMIDFMPLGKRNDT
jgi:hypothetical protein